MARPAADGPNVLAGFVTHTCRRDRSLDMSDARLHAISDEPAPVSETPEDVAILYSWANVPGAKYRDFSASRREYRAQQRARQTEKQREAELASAHALQELARGEFQQAQQTLQQSRDAEAETAVEAGSQVRAETAFRQAEANVRREQEEAQRHRQSAETLRLRAQSARDEMMAARQRAEEQAARYAEYDAQYREQLDHGDDQELPPGQLDDPYRYTDQVDPAYFASKPGVRTAQATHVSTERMSYVYLPHPGSDEFDSGSLQEYRPNAIFEPSPTNDSRTLAERSRTDEQKRTGGWDSDGIANTTVESNGYSDSGPAVLPDRTQYASAADPHTAEHGFSSHPRQQPVWRALERSTETRSGRAIGIDRGTRTVRQQRRPDAADISLPLAREAETVSLPAWLSRGETLNPNAEEHLPPVPAESFPRSAAITPSSPHASHMPSAVSRVPHGAASQPDSPQPPPVDAPAHATPPSENTPPRPDTLQQSRERVASRWFALRGLVDRQDHTDVQPRPAEQTAPVISLFSLNGGVGRTSLAATLGRALSALGETVLLADTNTHGLLPSYFGARDLRSGAVRTFTPPPGSADAPVLTVHYDLDRVAHDEGAQGRLLADLAERSRTVQRVFVDLGPGSLWLLRRLLWTNSCVLVPLAPDMNSVLTIEAIELLFTEMRDTAGGPVRPRYVLNQYDPGLPLHLDVREVLRQSLGDRLLPLTVHRAPAISEALAEGMTVIDYAPGTPIAEEFKSLAAWLRDLAVPGTAKPRGVRWSER